ncbi:MAG: hypothetical protein ACYTEQ_03375 [Planctomycetota bacterium]
MAKVGTDKFGYKGVRREIKKLEKIAADTERLLADAKKRLKELDPNDEMVQTSQ